MWAGMVHLVFGTCTNRRGRGLAAFLVVFHPEAQKYFSHDPCQLRLSLAWRIIHPWCNSPMRYRWTSIMDGGGFWVMVVVTYLMTLIIEWPFVAWCPSRNAGLVETEFGGLVRSPERLLRPPFRVVLDGQRARRFTLQNEHCCAHRSIASPIRCSCILSAQWMGMFTNVRWPVKPRKGFMPSTQKTIMTGYLSDRAD